MIKRNAYFLTITNNNNTISGHLIRTSDNKEIDFNPIIVLGDFLNIPYKHKNSMYEQANYSLSENYYNHPFFLDTDCIEDIFSAFVELKKIIENNISLSLYEFEFLRQFLRLKFTYEIQFKEKNPIYNNRSAEKLGYNVKSKCQFIGVQYTFEYNFKKLFEYQSNTSHKFIYNCTSIDDIIFSVFHYLMFSNYKFVKCQHCGKYFATKTTKTIYCPRNSPYTYETTETCSEVTNKILTKVRKRRKNTLKHINDNYPKAYKPFNDEYDLLFKKPKSVSNLMALESFFSKEEVKSNWYIDKYK